MELGSNFELNVSNLCYTKDNIFRYLDSYFTVFTDSGRSASIVLNMIIKPGIILLPSYICESVINVYRDKFSLIFYNIRKDFSVDMKDFEGKIHENVTAVYVMHYFGQLQDQEFLFYLQRKKEQYGFTIIEDTTHSFFTKRNTVGDYCICSLRKWFPVMDGGILYSEKSLKNIPTEDIFAKEPSAGLAAMILKSLHIQGKVDCKELYRKMFTEEEAKLDRQKDVYKMSEISKALLNYFSVSEMVEKRKRNYKELEKVLLESKIEVVLKQGEYVPLSCPIYIEQRDGFRQYLAEHQVYCAVHWPLAGTGLEGNKGAKDISEHIISLPIDQRYGREHIQYLGKLIKDYVRNR